MRRADGVEVCSRAARLDDGLKVVVITSYVDPEERRKVQLAGAAAYLLKDLDTPGLVERLQALADAPARPAGDRANGAAERKQPRRKAAAGRGEEPLVNYTRILVPLDGSKLSEQAVPFAATLASALGSSIELIRIFGSASPGMADPGRGLYVHQLDAGFREQALDYLNQVGQSLGDLALKVSCTADGGDPASWIINEAEKVPGTLIIMSTHGRSGITRWVLGSVTDKVFRAAVTPLVIIRARNDRSLSTEMGLINRVVVPLDGSFLAEQSLPHVVALAKGLRLTTVLLRIGNHHEQARCRRYLSKVGAKLRRQGLTSVEELVLEGRPAETIIDTAQETPSSLVAMTTHGRSGMRRWVLGSVTDRVARHSGGPILVIRPAE